MSRKVLKVVLGGMIMTLILMGCAVVSEISATEGAMTTASTEREVSSPTMTRLALTGEFTRQPPPPPENIPPTWTPLATLAPNLARDLTMELYENNPCRLPCWWNIVPGETNWNEAWQFLGQLATNDFPWDVSLQESRVMPGYMSFRVYLPVPETYPDFGHLLFYISIDTFTVEYINLVSAGVEDYSASEILTEYGIPDKILFLFFGEGDGWMYFYYPQNGFLSAYAISVTRTNVENGRQICIQDYSVLLLWPPSKPVEIEQMVNLYVPGVHEGYLNNIRTTEEVWAESKIDLYQTILEEGNCFTVHILSPSRATP